MADIKLKKKHLAVVGHSVPKVDALNKVLGKAVYSEDIALPQMLFGRVLRAGVPHAIIERIDTTKAEAMDGVVCILTAKDIRGKNLYGIAFQDQTALAAERVRYIGDPVALVAAESNEISKAAVKAIKVDYKELPVVTNPREALSDLAPKIHKNGNLILHSKTRKGNIEQGFKEASVIV